MASWTDGLRHRWEIFRRRRNILTQSSMQLKFALTFTFVFVGIFLTLSAIYLFFLVQILHVPIFYSGEEFLLLISDQWLAFAMLSLAVLCLPFAIAFSGILLTHRLVGPFVPINRHLKALRAGDYAQGPIRIRQSDYIKEFVDLLNQVVDAMKKREADAAHLLKRLSEALTREDYDRVKGMASEIQSAIAGIESRYAEKRPLPSYDKEA